MTIDFPCVDFGSSFSVVLTDEQGRVKAIWVSFSTQLKYCSTSEDHQFATVRCERRKRNHTYVISWCWCYLQDLHPEERVLSFLLDEGHGVYVTRGYAY
nr:protease Do-like 7 [Tanacetum cinerariifolium]